MLSTFHGLLACSQDFARVKHTPAPFRVTHPQLERGESAPLPHLALLEVGGVQLLFMVNALAVQRALARMEHLVM